MSYSAQSGRLLIISQVYPPDPASVGQHMAEAAQTLVERGYVVRVLTANRGYADPTNKYPSREQLDGVEVVRLPFSSFGKGSLAVRILAQLFFVAQAGLRGLFTPRLSGVLVSTSPPMAGAAALLISFFRRKPLTFWAMDLNVDQMIASGSLKASSPLAWLLRDTVRRTMKRAKAIVVLDRFMEERVAQNYGISERVHVIPPWPLEDVEAPVPHEENSFRREHDLDGKFVFMYSGNMGVGHPIGTMLEAARRLEAMPDVVFMFIGGGVRRQEVEEAIRDRNPPNLRLLPYQPLHVLRYSLSAADVHLATMDEEGVGYFHPCKVYGAMSVGRPILFAGPDPSHVTDLIRRYKIGWRVAPSDPGATVEIMQQIVATPPAELAAMGQRGRQAIQEEFSQRKLCNQFCDHVAATGPVPQLRSSTKEIRAT